MSDSISEPRDRECELRTMKWKAKAPINLRSNTKTMVLTDIPAEDRV